MEVACDLVRFYDTIGRPMTAANMKWSPVMRNFGLLWKSLIERRDADEPAVPKVTKNIPPMKWCEDFEDHVASGSEKYP